MKAHIVGGGYGGLAAAACLIRNAGVPGPDITIYEAEEKPGGGFFLGGSAETGYNLPGSVFDSEFRCTFDLLRAVPSASDPAVNVTDEFFAFNEQRPFNDKARLLDRDGRPVHGPRFGLTWRDGFDLARLSLTPEGWLEGRRIEECFAPSFFESEFWLCYSTVMGSLPQHSAAELRRYINRTLHMLPSISDMANIWRTRFDQYQTLVEPLVAWLDAHGVTLETGAFVSDVGLAPGLAITVDRLTLERSGTTTSIAVAPDDVVILTFGSQVADMSVGSMTAAPRPKDAGRSWALWKRLAGVRPEFGNPEAFFGAAHIPDSRWVGLTITTRGTELTDAFAALTGNATGTGGLVSLVDSPWLLSLSAFHQPEIIGQPEGTFLLWGYGLFPHNLGQYVRKRMNDCTGAEILEELLLQLGFRREFDAIMASSICIPCDMPYVNNIWMLRGRGDRPLPVPPGSTNLGIVGQYVELPRDVAFTIEYSIRAAWEAVHLLLRRGPPPPPVYQARFDIRALLAALKVFVRPRSVRP